MKKILLLIICLIASISMYANGVTIMMSRLHAVDITNKNIFDFDIMSNYSTGKRLKLQGKLHFRNSRHVISYVGEITLQPGINSMRDKAIALQYTSNELKQLFSMGSLPSGSYEYCISITDPQQQNESGASMHFQECTFGNNDHVFLIELAYPEDDAKIKEFYPQLTWIVNAPIVSQLQYRVKLTEIRPKQNKITAIQRNNLLLDFKYHPVNSLNYPASGRQLQVNQPYVWTVDAYFKDILIGTAVPWKFTIIEDSAKKVIPLSRSYYDFATIRQQAALQITDTIKLKYDYAGMNTSIPYVVIKQEGGKDAILYEGKMELTPGWNYKNIAVKKSKHKHEKTYFIKFSIEGKTYEIPFKYIDSNKL